MERTSEPGISVVAQGGRVGKLAGGFELIEGPTCDGRFQPVADEATSYRAQAVLAGRVVVSGPG